MGNNGFRYVAALVMFASIGSCRVASAQIEVPLPGEPLGWADPHAPQDGVPEFSHPASSPKDIADPKLIELNKRAAELRQREMRIGCRLKKRVFDPEIVILLKDAEQHGYKVVAYVDNGSGGMTHEDIFALRLATAEEKKKGAFSVQLASQHGMNPSRVPGVGLKTRAEKAKDENAVLNKFSGELGWLDASDL